MTRGRWAQQRRHLTSRGLDTSSVAPHKMRRYQSAASFLLLCVVWIATGCATTSDALSIHDLPAIPELEPYEGTEEIRLDCMINALRTGIDNLTLEVAYYWDPSSDSWDELVASYAEQLDSRAWAKDEKRTVADTAVWKRVGSRMPQRLVLASVPQPSEGRIVAVFLIAQ